MSAETWLNLRGGTVWWPNRISGDLYMQNVDSERLLFWRLRATTYGEFDALATPPRDTVLHAYASTSQHVDEDPERSWQEDRFGI